VSGMCHTLVAVPKVRDPVPIVQEAGWPPDPSPESDPRAFQSVTSCYTY